MIGLLTLVTALAGECERIGLADIKAVPAPAVIVLGERHGHQPDLARAARVVAALRRTAPVRVALEAVHERFQPVLNDAAEGKVGEDDLPALLDWERSWGFAYAPYRPLVMAGQPGAPVIAAGLTLGPRPEDRAVPLPPRYLDLLRPAMGGHPIPPGQEGTFVQSMAWRDLRIAELGLQGWDGKGYAVIVTGRGHVEGGLGVSWQAQRMTEVPVHAFVLAQGPNPPCHDGDKLWR